MDHITGELLEPAAPAPAPGAGMEGDRMGMEQAWTGIGWGWSRHGCVVRVAMDVIVVAPCIAVVVGWTCNH